MVNPDLIDKSRKIRKRLEIFSLFLKNYYGQRSSGADVSAAPDDEFLFLKKRRASDMGLQAIFSLIANLSCHDQQCDNFVARS